MYGKGLDCDGKFPRENCPYTQKTKALGEELIQFKVNKSGFQINYNKEGIPTYKGDRYFIYLIKGKKKKLIVCMTGDECILLSALLNFAVHSRLTEHKSID